MIFEIFDGTRAHMMAMAGDGDDSTLPNYWLTKVMITPMITDDKTYDV